MSDREGGHMAQAWEVRASERQEIVSKIMRRVYGKSDEIAVSDSIDHFVWDLGKALYTRMETDGRTTGVECRVGIDSFLKTELIKPIVNFSRSEAECKVLLAELFEKIWHLASSPFYTKLRGEEVGNPKLIFQAPSATAEVAFSKRE